MIIRFSKFILTKYLQMQEKTCFLTQKKLEFAKHAIIMRITLEQELNFFLIKRTSKKEKKY